MIIEIKKFIKEFEEWIENSIIEWLQRLAMWLTK